jgi:hypothetical protein
MFPSASFKCGASVIQRPHPVEGQLRGPAASVTEGATVIFDAAKADRRWILVGADAEWLGELVHQSPEREGEIEFFPALAERQLADRRKWVDTAACVALLASELSAATRNGVKSR